MPVDADVRGRSRCRESAVGNRCLSALGGWWFPRSYLRAPPGAVVKRHLSGLGASLLCRLHRGLKPPALGLTPWLGVHPTLLRCGWPRR